MCDRLDRVLGRVLRGAHPTSSPVQVSPLIQTPEPFTVTAEEASSHALNVCALTPGLIPSTAAAFGEGISSEITEVKGGHKGGTLFS